MAHRGSGPEARTVCSQSERVRRTLAEWQGTAGHEGLLLLQAAPQRSGRNPQSTASAGEAGLRSSLRLVSSVQRYDTPHSPTPIRFQGPRYGRRESNFQQTEIIG